MIFQNCPKYHMLPSGGSDWDNFEISQAGIIAKYHAHVMLYLFVIEGEKFSATHKRPLFREILSSFSRKQKQEHNCVQCCHGRTSSF